MDAASASILSALIVGTVSILATIIANGFSYLQQKTQWDREEKRAERIEIQAQKDKEFSIKLELTNRLQEIYSNSIASLTALLIYNDSSMRLRPDYQENLKDAQKCLLHIVVNHYDKESKDYETFLSLYNSIYNTREGYAFIEQVRSMIINFAAKDPRLQNIELKIV